MTRLHIAQLSESSSIRMPDGNPQQPSRFVGEFPVYSYGAFSCALVPPGNTGGVLGAV